MPSQVRIISARNSREWDRLVQSVADAGQLGEENTYGGCVSEERADKVRRSIRTAAKHLGYGAKVYWRECGQTERKRCQFGAGCSHHVLFTIYDLDDARRYKARQQRQQRRH